MNSYSKTFFKLFTCYRDRLPNYNGLEINMDTKIVNTNIIRKIKYLGVYIDPYLKWNYHIDFVVTKLRCHLSKFNFFKEILDTKQMQCNKKIVNKNCILEKVYLPNKLSFSGNSDL